MAETEKLTSRRMGEMQEGKLLLSMALPMMISMLTQALYNVVDSVYVSMVSEDCLAALSLAFPAQNIMIGIATGTGVGVSTLISRALGSGRPDRANRAAGNSLFLMLCCWALMALFGVFGARWFIASQTDNAVIRDYGASYLQIVTIGSLCLYAEFGFNRLLQSTGLTKLSMWVQLTGAVTNIILDPFFIFGWCGLPAMGTAGAAIATVIGQAVGASVAVAVNLRRNRELCVRLRDIRPDGWIIRQVYRIGFPSIIMMAIGSVMTYCMNDILIAFSSTAVAVFGAYFKLQSFVFMPVFGLNNGMIPIIGYNYGAGKKERIYRTIRFAALYATIIMLLGAALFQLFPSALLRAFSASGEMLRIGVPALRRISISFLLAGVSVVASSACQALDRSIYSLYIAFLRQIVVLVPAAYLLARTGDVNMVWWAFPIAEVMSFAVSTLLVRRALRRMERSLEGRAERLREEKETV